MITVSLIGTLLLLPMLGLGSVMEFSPWAYIGYFMVVVNLMLYLHYKRTKVLNISIVASISWVLYRIVVLGLIFILK
jgi:hypothetical protein